MAPTKESWPDVVVETDAGCYPPFGADRVLIASAPELYEALAAICELLLEDEDLVGAQQVARGIGRELLGRLTTERP